MLITKLNEEALSCSYQFLASRKFYGPVSSPSAVGCYRNRKCRFHFPVRSPHSSRPTPHNLIPTVLRVISLHRQHSLSICIAPFPPLWLLSPPSAVSAPCKLPVPFVHLVHLTPPPGSFTLRRATTSGSTAPSASPRGTSRGRASQGRHLHDSSPL